MNIPIIIPMPINTNITKECITSSGKTYCESNKIPPEVIGWTLLATTLWITTVFILMSKALSNEISSWWAGSYIITTVVIISAILISN